MKTKAMENFLSEFTTKTFGTNYAESIQTKHCVICGGRADNFDDELSRKEFEISAMCQACQNDTFDEFIEFVED